MTRHELVDVDLGHSLEIAYEYRVAGINYRGDRKRFMYRGYRVGTDDAIKLANKWGPGNKVKVFYDPNSPADSVVDNTFCKGDQLQAGLNITGFLVALMVIAGILWFQNRKQVRSFDETVEPNGVVAIQLSNCLLYTSPSPRDATLSRMPSSA